MVFLGPFRFTGTLCRQHRPSHSLPPPQLLLLLTFHCGGTPVRLMNRYWLPIVILNGSLVWGDLCNWIMEIERGFQQPLQSLWECGSRSRNVTGGSRWCPRGASAVQGPQLDAESELDKLLEWWLDQQKGLRSRIILFLENILCDSGSCQQNVRTLTCPSFQIAQRIRTQPLVIKFHESRKSSHSKF